MSTKSELARKLTAAFLLGFLLGGASLLALVAARLEEAALQRDLFLSIAQKQRQRLVQMRNQLEEFQTKPTIEAVEIHIAPSEDRSTATDLALKEKLREFSKEIVGDVVEKTDPQLLKDLYHERDLRHKDTHYLVTVNTLIVAQIVHFYLTIESTDRDISE